MRQWMNLFENHRALETALNDLIVKALDRGMKLELTYSDREIEMHWIARRSAAKGSGAEVINRLCAIADQFGMPISLYAFGADPGLMAYYERFGFVEDPTKGDEAWMKRAPASEPYIQDNL